MQIAFAKASLDPVRPIKACGYAQQTEPMSRIRDALEARLMLILQEDGLYILCAVDLLSGTDTLHDRLEARLAEAFGAPVHFFICGTHTHFGPDITDEEYSTDVEERIFRAAAAASFREAQLTCGFTTEAWQGVGKSRISHWETDQVLAHTLCLYEGETRLATLVIYNCHPTVLNGYTPFFTAEYPGVMRRTLQARHPGEFFAFLQGAAGDVSTRFTRREQTEEEMERFGLRMADEADALMARTTPTAPVRMTAVSAALPMVHSLKDPGDIVIPDYIGQRERDTLVYGIAAARRNLEHPERLRKSMALSALGFGSFSLVFSEYELFSEYNKALDPETSALVCYSNGYHAYIAGPSFDGITYETLHDTLTDECRVSLMETLGRLGREVLQ